MYEDEVYQRAMHDEFDGCYPVEYVSEKEDVISQYSFFYNTEGESEAQNVDDGQTEDAD